MISIFLIDLNITLKHSIMTISKKVEDAFNAQITAELWSSNIYLEMAFWFRKEGWEGFAKWMYKQAEEEREHAFDMADFVLNRGGEAKVSAIDAVPMEFKDPQDVFEQTYAHEQKVTELINKLSEVAEEENDRASINFIAKYIDEQVEEEKNVRAILHRFYHQKGHAIGLIDQQLGARE